MIFIILFVLFAVVFAIIDAIWLKSSAALYRKELGHVMRDKPNFVAAVAFYCIYVFGVTYFSLYPAVESQQLIQAIMSSAVLAFVAYATYDLTNLATIKGWSTKIVIIDLIWGAVATTAAATATYLIAVEMIGL